MEDRGDCGFYRLIALLQSQMQLLKIIAWLIIFAMERLATIIARRDIILANNAVKWDSLNEGLLDVKSRIPMGHTYLRVARVRARARACTR